MADLSRIKRNVSKMVSMNAPESDIDAYIQSEGVTIDDVRGFKPEGSFNKISKEQLAQPSGDYMEGVIPEAIKGFGKGALSAIESGLNSATFGAYDWLNRKFFNDAYGKRQSEIQRAAEAEGLGGLNKAANLLTELAAGGATTGNVAYNLAGKAGLSGLSRLAGAGALEGGAFGLTGSDTLKEAAVNVPSSAVLGGVGSASLGGLGNALKRFSPKLMSVGLKSNIEDALTDSESVKALKRGAMDEDIANQLLAKEPEIKNALNTRSAESLEELTGNRFDVTDARNANRKAYEDYFAQNAKNFVGKPEGVVPFTSYDTVNKLKEAGALYQRAMYDDYFTLPNGRRIRLSDHISPNHRSYVNVEYGGIEPSTKISDEEIKRILSLPEVKTPNHISYIPNTEYKGIDFSNLTNGQLKTFITEQTASRPSGLQTDFAVELRRRGLISDNEYNSVLDYSFREALKNKKILEGIEKKTVKNIKEAFPDYYIKNRADADYLINKTASDYNKYLNLKDFDALKVSKSNFSNVDDKLASYDITKDLSPETEFQKKSLKTALSKANDMTNAPSGTLAHTNEVKKALNDMIDKSMTQGSNLQMKPTNETRQLMVLKNNIDDLLRKNSEIKNLDAEYARLSGIESSYQQGSKATPRTRTRFANDEERTAFLKGAVDNLLSDVKTDSNLSRAIMNKQNVLNKAMNKTDYDALMSGTSENAGQYERLNDIMNKARISTGRYSNLESPANLRELGDSKASALLYGLGKVANMLYGRTNREVAQRIIDGLPNAERSMLLEALARINPVLSGSYINEEYLGR